MNCCDEYGDCRQGRDCPVRKQSSSLRHQETSMSKEAMKLALEALEDLIPLCDPGFSVCYDVNKAITALREALAKPDFWEGYVPEPVKPAQQLVDCHATGVCVQSGLRAEQPAQQEPVARQYQNRDGVWKDFISEKHYKDTLEDGSWPIRNLYTSPPAQRTWVSLTDEQIENLDCVYPLWDDGESCTIMGIKDFARAIEAKLKEKNT